MKKKCRKTCKTLFYFVSLHQENAKLLTQPQSLRGGAGMTFEGKILAFVLYSVMSLNLGNSIDTHETNKCQRLRFWRGLDLSS